MCSTHYCMQSAFLNRGGSLRPGRRKDAKSAAEVAGTHGRIRCAKDLFYPARARIAPVSISALAAILPLQAQPSAKFLARIFRAVGVMAREGGKTLTRCCLEPPLLLVVLGSGATLAQQFAGS